MVLTAGAECCKNTFTAVSPFVTDKKKKKKQKHTKKKALSLKPDPNSDPSALTLLECPLLGSGSSEQSYRG